MMSQIAFPDVVGMFGAAIIVVAYFLLQIERLDSRSLPFSVFNCMGAAAIIYSLYFEFNLSAFAIELFWLIISLYGVIRALRHRKEAGES
ncbi:MAG: hypothetical protein AB8G18_07185 [Gammaproteobacteria bacterium]